MAIYNTSTSAGATGAGIDSGQTALNQLPGWQQDFANIGATIGSETAGQLPQDVITQLQQAGAEGGAASGMPGSGASNAAYMKALGLTSLGLTQQGQNNLQSFESALPGYNLSQNPAFQVTPAQNEQASEFNAQMSMDQQAQQAAAAQQQAALAAEQAGLKAGQNAGGGGAPIVRGLGGGAPGFDDAGSTGGTIDYNPSNGGWQGPLYPSTTNPANSDSIQFFNGGGWGGGGGTSVSPAQGAGQIYTGTAANAPAWAQGASVGDPNSFDPTAYNWTGGSTNPQANWDDPEADVAAQWAIPGY